MGCSFCAEGDCKEGCFDSQAVKGLLFLSVGGVEPGSLFMRGWTGLRPECLVSNWRVAKRARHSRCKSWDIEYI